MQLNPLNITTFREHELHKISS